jgi:hypothetical protein
MADTTPNGIFNDDGIRAKVPPAHFTCKARYESLLGKVFVAHSSPAELADCPGLAFTMNAFHFSLLLAGIAARDYG